MENTAETGFKPIPLALKIVAVLLILWILGAVMNVGYMYENGLPLLGRFVTGWPVVLVVFCLDILGPVGFLYGLWTRKSWAPKWATVYMGAFILNSIVAFFTVRDVLPAPQILAPMVASLIFLAVIHWKRGYFSK
jgi:hypothetical protein